MSYELKDFQSQIIDRSHEIPVVVDFWAPWCGPCKQLGPVIEDLAGKADGRWELVKVNTEDHPQVALDHEITGIPDVRMFRKGEVAGGFQGFLPPAEIEAWLAKYLPSVRENDISAARELAEAGNPEEALEQISGVLASEPGNDAARLLAAEWALRFDPAKTSALLANVQDDSEIAEQSAALRVLAQFVADGDKLSAAGEGKSGDAFANGLAGLRAGDTERWIDQWIETMERKKDFADGRLAEAVKAVFRYLGPRHPVTDANYRRFTSSLY